MLKKIVLLILSFFAVNYCFATNLIQNANFKDGFNGWFVSNPKVYSVKGNILSIKASPEVSQRKKFAMFIQKIKLPPKMVSGKKFTFSLYLKAVKISGRIKFAIREIDISGKTVKYQQIWIKRRDKFDWKKFSKTFTASPKTIKLAVYIAEYYLQEDDNVQARDFVLESVKQ